jgi:hypothetical protein
MLKKKEKKQCLMIKTQKKYAKKIMTIKILKFNYIQLIKSFAQVISLEITSLKKPRNLIFN